MKVILTADVPKIGKQGEVINVSDGYARNYLFPRKLGVEASAAKINELQQKSLQEEKRKGKEEDKAVRIKQLIEGQQVTIKAKCGDGGKLFGAVTSKEIADALNKAFKVDIDKKKVEIKDPIRHLGDYPVRIKIHQKAQTEITVRVEEL